MAGVTTRTLVLGAVRTFEPVNGYQLFRELRTWHMDEWTDIKLGSVYSMLSTLTKQGLVQRYDLDERGKSVAVYTVTEDGDEEFLRLVEEGIVTVSGVARTQFRVAFSFTPLLPRATFLEWMERRLALVRRGAKGLAAAAEQIAASGTAPPHIGYSLGLEGRLLDAEAAWIEDLLTVVRGGGLVFVGEPEGWTPPEGDVGWEMQAPRERYREQIRALADIKGRWGP